MRLTPEYRLPPYTYVPGKLPHPIRDPAGHHVEGPPCPPRVELPKDWESCPPYLYGFDLFNAGYYWEAHEAWEAVWHHAGRVGPVADLVKGLIKLAAALVKAREGRTAGVRRHATRAAELAQSVQESTHAKSFMGLKCTELVQIANTLAADANSYDSRDAEGVVVLLSQRIVPRGDEDGCHAAPSPHHGLED